MASVEIRHYKNIAYAFNKYGRTEFTLFCDDEELFFAAENDVRYYIDNITIYQTQLKGGLNG